MWILRPVGWLAQSYTVEERGKPVATLAFGGWRVQPAIEIDGRRLPIRREGFWNPKFHLSDARTILGTARSAGAFRRGFLLDWGKDEYRVEASSTFSRSFDLLQRARALGRIRALGVFSWRAEVDLDEELPLELRLFTAWLVLLAWRRAAAAAAAS